MGQLEQPPAPPAPGPVSVFLKAPPLPSLDRPEGLECVTPGAAFGPLGHDRWDLEAESGVTGAMTLRDAPTVSQHFPALVNPQW